jgi:hypothetical protein
LSESPDILRVQADTLRRRKAWYEAGLLYQKLARVLPDDLEICRGRLECARKQNHAVMAGIILEEALNSHPEWDGRLSDDQTENLKSERPAELVRS